MTKKSRKIVKILTMLLVFKAIPCLGQVDSCAAWSSQEGGGANIYFAERENGEWQGARKITSEEGINITPTVSMAENDDIWLVWVKVAGDVRTLKYFSRQQEGEVTGEIVSLAGKPCFSPSIIIDGQGQPWLAWTIDDGTDEDIYYSRWNGSTWQIPQRVHPDNTVPDITPTIGLATSGSPWISWENFDGSSYVTRTVFWHQNSWQSVSDKPEQHTFQSIAEGQENSLPPLPQTAQNRLMGSLYVRGGEIQSMSERIFKLTPRRTP